MFINEDMRVNLMNCLEEFHPDTIYWNYVLEVEGQFFVVLLSTLSHICKDQRSNRTFQQYCTFLPIAMAESILGFTLFKSHTLSSCLQTKKFQVNHSSRLVKWFFDISISSHASNSKMEKKMKVFLSFAAKAAFKVYPFQQTVAGMYSSY